MFETVEKSPTLEQGKYVEMVDASTEVVVPREGTMEACLVPKIIELNSHATPVEKFKLFLVDPLDLTKTLLMGNKVNLKERQELKYLFLKNLDIFT